jgi:ferredoxin-NADP reductase
MSSSPLQALIHTLRYEATGITSVELRPLPGSAAFPAVQAGAHIDLHLGNGLVRSYSLTNPGEQHRYVVAVLNDRHSRGGSRYVHEQLRVGQSLSIGAPRNHFALDERAEHTVLVAGGIGVTPIYAMLQRLLALGRSVEVVYCARSRAEAAYLAAIEALAAAADGGAPRFALQLHLDTERGAPPDLKALLAGRAPTTHFYCCGPAPMLDAYESACAQLGYAQVHMERFAAAPIAAPASTDACTIELKRSGKLLQVGPGVSILDAMLAQGLNPDHSCREGICGACEIKVISGDVEHLDQILTKQEKAANKSMMVCVSRCRSGTLVLDA